MNPTEYSRHLAIESLARNDATSWFERLYLAAEKGEATVPWERTVPNRLLVQWAEQRQLQGAGQRALIVGCGFGADAEYLAGLGFDTVAFDIAPTAVRLASERFPQSRVRYVVADLLNPPADWREAFDLVVEIITVQSLPDPPRREAIARVTEMVRQSGTLFVVAAARQAGETTSEGPPWPLSRAEVEAFAAGGLQMVRLENIPDVEDASLHRWRAELQRLEPAL